MAYEWVYNLAKVEWWEDKIPLDKNEAFINNLPDTFLENVKNQLEWEWIELKNLQAVKDIINAWGGNWVNIDYKISFARMWECLNDAIILDSFTISGGNKEFNRSVTSTMNLQDTDVDYAWVAYVDHVRKQSDNTQTNPTTDPDNVQTETTVNNNGNVTDNNADNWGFIPVDPDSPVDNWWYNGTKISKQAFNNQKIAEGAATAHQHITNNEK